MFEHLRLILGNISPTRIWITVYILACSCTWVHLLATDTNQNSTTKATKDGGIARVIREAENIYSTTGLDVHKNSRPLLLKALRGKLCKERKRSKAGRSSTDIKLRIVGGNNAQPHEFPHQVVFKDRFGQPLCGGTIYNEFYIISAAHCFTPDIPRMTPTVGAYKISTRDGSEQVLSVRSTKLHENYNTKTFQNDIALIALNSPIKFSKFVQPAQLPTTYTKRDGKRATVTGWGALKFGGRQPDILQKVSVPLVTNEQCEQAYPDFFKTQLCAGFVGKGGKDACQGDSGGPLTVKNCVDKKTTYTLIGIVSSGSDCASPIYPGVYTDVFQYVDWIKKNAV